MNKGGKSETQSPLIAILPGAKIDSEKGKISINVGLSQKTIVFNIGGAKFETYESTLLKQPRCRLANEKFLRSHYRADVGDYFFDRDPESFRVVLNYLRTGELHLPSFICGPAIKNELEFWGVPETDIERCCNVTYNSYNATLDALNQLERDRKGGFLLSEEDKVGVNGSNSERVRHGLALILNQPESSIYAKIYGAISLLVVAVSILAFLAESHPYFQVQNKDNTINKTINTTIKHPDFNTDPIPHPTLRYIDFACMAFFTVEYILRVLVAQRRCRYIRSLMGLIDLLALLPDYVRLILLAADPDIVHSVAAKVLTILKVTRILRIFRLIRHVPGLWILIYTLKASVKELLLMVAFLMVGMLVFSSLIYYADERETFPSIPHGFWWALITMTTVGYGDMYPVTPLGYLVGSLTAMSGLLMIGFSVPILVNNFLMYYRHLEAAIHEEKLKKLKEAKDKSEQTKNDNNNKQLYSVELKEEKL